MDLTMLGYPFLLNICTCILYCLGVCVCVCVCVCALHVHIICVCQCMYTCVNLQVCDVSAWAMVVCVHVHKYTVCMVCIPACGVQYLCNSSLPFFPHAYECYRYSRLQLSHQLLECTTTKLQFYSFHE